MSTINYVIGDATKPQGSGTKIICHCCNDEGKWGSGFVVALSKRWNKPEQSYRNWASEGKSDRVLPLDPDFRPMTKQVPFKLGSVIFVQVEIDIWVANIIGQHKTIRSIRTPIRYDALREGFQTVYRFCHRPGDSVHMPRLGAGLAGGNWNIIKGIIQDEIVAKGLNATVYDLYI